MLVLFQIYGDLCHCKDIKTINQPWDNVPELDCDLRVQSIETFTRFFFTFLMIFDAIARLILRMMSRAELGISDPLSIRMFDTKTKCLIDVKHQSLI